MNATQAIERAKEHLAMFAPDAESLRIEAVQPNKETENWKVTLSFFDDDTSLPSALLAKRNRVYKIIEIDKNGELINIEMLNR